MKRGYALDITTLFVFHHLLSCYLLSLAKIRLLFRIPNKEYRKNDIKKRQSFAHIANDSSPVFRIESYHVLAKYFKAFALTGRQVCVRNNPGQRPGYNSNQQDAL